MGELSEIWIKRSKRGPMDPRDSTLAIVDEGLEGNADRGGRRQVTLLSHEGWREACDELGVDVPPEARRANLYLVGIDLADSRGKTLEIGRVAIRIFGETRPCERMGSSLRRAPVRAVAALARRGARGGDTRRTDPRRRHRELGRGCRPVRVRGPQIPTSTCVDAARRDHDARWLSSRTDRNYSQRTTPPCNRETHYPKVSPNDRRLPR